MPTTKKSMVDDVLLVAQKFVESDDSRLSDRWISNKLDEIRAQLIIRNYKNDETVDFAWASQLFYVDFYKVTVADDPNIISCNCNMMKSTIPPVVSITNSNANNQDIGIWALMSACGKYSYSPRPLQMLQNIPSEHTFAKFKYYARQNTTIYATGEATKLRLSAILLHPEDGYIINSAPITSGNIVSGTDYIVKFGTVVYNSVTYYANQTFTGVGVATFTGTGKVYLVDQVSAFEETSDYPVGGEMAREIVLEILTKEFQISDSMITDVKNDNFDAQREIKAPLQEQRSL